VRMFPMEMVKDIMHQQLKIWGHSQCRIMDDTFAVTRARVYDFCEMATQEFKNRRMSCLTHCKTADLETMKFMQATGFDVVAFGIESGNDTVLKLINKKTTVSESAEAIRIAREAHLFVEGLYMLGNIGDTEQTCLDTIEFAKKHNPPYSASACWNWFQFATPFPGSRFFAEAEQYGTVTTRDYGAYHHQTPVFIPNGMTAQQLIRLREKAFREAK
jgi:anaerobic magnesium-protoporphyrin IX monomethyl ester cyclase